MFIAALFIIATELETTQMSNWWMYKQNVLYPYSELFVNKKEWSSGHMRATTWMNLEDVMLTEKRQTQKPTYCMISFIWSVQDSQIQRQKLD